MKNEHGRYVLFMYNYYSNYICGCGAAPLSIQDYGFDPIPAKLIKPVYSESSN